jgi:hypothetical protein
MEPISSLRKIPEMITMPHYEPSTPGDPHRGDIYRFKPVAWLRPPLWLLRYTDFAAGRAGLVLAKQIRDTFRKAEHNHQEYVLAEAKLRYVILMSPSQEIKSSHIRDLLVLPLYTIDPDALPSHRLARLRANPASMRDRYYLPAEPAYGIAEAYADFRRMQLMARQFLAPEDKIAHLTDTTLAALIERYRSYWLLR